MAQQNVDIQSLPLSTSVRRAISQYSPQQQVAAREIVAELLNLHPEYARGMAKEIQLTLGGSDRRTVEEWFTELSQLFDLERVRQKVRWINGQLTIWGLAQLEPNLRGYLSGLGFLKALEEEYLEENGIHPSELVRHSTEQAPVDDVRTRIERARNITDEQSRVQAYIELFPDVQEKVLREQLTFTILDDVTKIIDSFARVSLLSRFLPQMDEEMRRDVASTALQYVQAIEDTSLRKAAFDSISPYLTEQEQKPGVSVPRSRTTPRQKTSPPYFPPIAGYISDIAGEKLKDLLNIDREVANIANVLTFKQVQPPLALGLFGDWGSGKTFFMGKLRKYVDEIARHYQKEEQRSETEAMWCSRVAQIDFNAWHFSDSNLWASLVTRIYEGLDRELNREKETADHIKRKILQAQIQEAQERSVEAETQLDLAKTRVDSAEENLKQKSKEREEKESTFLGLISSLPDLLGGTRLQQPLQEAATALGVPEAAQTYEALEQLNREVKSVSGRLAAVTASILHSRLALVWMAFFVVLLPFLFTLAIETWGGFLNVNEAGRRVAEVSTFLFFIVSWLQAQVRRGTDLVATLESALEAARNIRQRRIEEDKSVVEARKALTEAQAAEQAARTNLDLAQTEFQRLQLELQELRPERKLQRLIEMRASTGAYAQHLGIISLIRSDFENMSRILAEMIEERRDFKTAPPIQRIILYIDDLDRCTPDRVVEVLEAIHLLLFFPLFVVVVAVDPRWLRHSLARQHPATLSESGGVGPQDASSTLSLFSTPQDYLEKIFQIPFALRPVERGGYQNLVNDLLKPLPEQKQPGAPERQASPHDIQEDRTETTGTPPPSQTETTPDIETRATGGEGATDLNRQDRHEETTRKKMFTPIPPRQLEFTGWEKEDIQRFWMMFRTPRTVKRFINTYRLLRAGLVSDRDVKKFEGTKRNPGEYQVALLLLALITAFPNEANELLRRLDAWLDIQELSHRQGDCKWTELVEALKNRAGPHPGNADKDGDDSTMDIYTTSDSWKLLINCMDQVIQDKSWNDTFRLAALRFWVMRVARFSFSVQPA